MTADTSDKEPRRPRTVVYIDGFNFYYGAVKGTHYKWLDFQALCQRLLPRDQVVKIRYFTARVTARPDDPQRASRQDTYLRALNDSDLAQAIQVAQSELSVKVGIINPHPRARRSRKLQGLNCLFYKQIPRQLLAETQLPAVVHDSKGPIRKPEGW